MNGRRHQQLDPRAWLAWGLAAGMPALLGRNPWPLLAVLVAVIGVRLAWADRMTGGRSWGLFLRIALIFAAIGVVFNVLTVCAGDHVIATLPGELPLIGGEISLNAAIYGLLSGLALVLLVMIGSTLAAVLDWSAIVRLLPESLTSIAVAGSIAFAFVPQTAVAYREIREAQSARGHRIRGARDLLPILVPMIGSGLERAITLAEALESRAFGAPASPLRDARTWTRYLGACALASATIAIYLLVSGRTAAAFAATGIAVFTLFLFVRTGEGSVMHRTSYRLPVWRRADTAVVAGSAIALLATTVTLETSSSALRYEPYPHLNLPMVSIPLLIGLLALLVPAFVSPMPERIVDTQS